MIKTFILAISSFISTNIDDFFIDSILFFDCKSKKETNEIIIGKYLGMSILVSISLVITTNLPKRFIGYLGFIPLALGIKEIIENLKKGDDELNQNRSSNKIINTTLITISDGADNIGIYIPIFAQLNRVQILITIIVFLILIYFYSKLALSITKIPLIKKFLEKYRSIIVPLVYISLGIYILINSII